MSTARAIDLIIVTFVNVCIILGVVTIVRGWVFEITSILKGLFESINMQRGLTHKILDGYMKSADRNRYASYLINSMIEFRNTAFWDSALATKFDEIISLWKTFIDKEK